jgi:hypothetical protein
MLDDTQGHQTTKYGKNHLFWTKILLRKITVAFENLSPSRIWLMVVNHKCIFNGIKALKVLMPLKIHLWFTTINCMLTVVIWWCLCCYLLIIYCNKLYIIKSFCFWWWNRNEKQKYNTNINICTNKSGPFIHETEHARYMQSYRVSVRKNWLLVKILTGSWLKTGTWRFFWLLLFGSQSSPCVGWLN